MWLAKSGHTDPFSSEEDIVFVSSDVAYKESNSANIAKFRSTVTDPVGYSDTPWFLNAVISQILTGELLSPGTKVIIADGDYLPADDQQCGGRMQRSREV